jgi:hypothetical protein
MMGQQQQTVTAAAGGALRRMLILLLAVAAVMAAMVALSVAPAFAKGSGTHDCLIFAKQEYGYTGKEASYFCRLNEF